VNQKPSESTLIPIERIRGSCSTSNHQIISRSKPLSKIKHAQWILKICHKHNTMFVYEVKKPFEPIKGKNYSELAKLGKSLYKDSVYRLDDTHNP
jgi:hypothetical protein